MVDLSAPSIFKAYDIRGLVESEITPDFAFGAGLAFARFLEQEREPGTMVIGEDMRPSSSSLAEAFSAGAISNGMDVIRIGLASTDMLYFASGKLNLPGVMITASHNPAEYNGIKLCKSGARPVGKETGLQTIERYVADGNPIIMRSIGVESQRNMVDEYVSFAHTCRCFGYPSFKNSHRCRQCYGGVYSTTCFERINVEVIELYFELDGTFPNHEANPIDRQT